MQLLQYFGLTSKILGKWKNYLKDENQINTTNLLAFDKMICKTIHRLLVENQDSNPPTAEKRRMEMGFSMEECQKFYSIPFVATEEIKLSMFQYKIIHSILYTKTVLHKMKKNRASFLSLLHKCGANSHPFICILSYCCFLLVRLHWLIPVRFQLSNSTQERNHVWHLELLVLLFSPKPSYSYWSIPNLL